MTPFPVSAQLQSVRSAFGFGEWVPERVRPLLAAVLVMALLLIYWSVVQGSVQRGQLLNRQMAETSSRCDGSANRSRAPDCSTLAAAGAVRNRSGLPPSAASVR